MKWRCSVLVLTSLLVLLGCAPPMAAPAPSPPATTETERTVTVTADGVILHYQQESRWSQARFATISQDRDGFSSELIQKFTDNVSKGKEGAEQIANARVEFNEGNQSTILKCDISGAIRESPSHRYQATFFWLLKPQGLDFIDNDFKESETGLSWQGSIEGIPTTIAIRLPAVDRAVYKAWAEPIGHCHAHVWWEIKP